MLITITFSFQLLKRFVFRDLNSVIPCDHLQCVEKYETTFHSLICKTRVEIELKLNHLYKVINFHHEIIIDRQTQTSSFCLTNTAHMNVSST